MINIIENETDAYILWAIAKCVIDGYEVPYLKIQKNNTLWRRAIELMDELEYYMKKPLEEFYKNE